MTSSIANFYQYGGFYECFIRVDNEDGRYYFKEAIKGFYGGGQVGFNTGKVELNSIYFTDSDISYTSIRIGGKAGYQWIWSSGLTVDLNVGYGLNTFSYNSDNALLGLSASGAFPNLGFGIGYSF